MKTQAPPSSRKPDTRRSNAIRKWVDLIHQLVDQAAQWAELENWSIHRDHKTIEEDALGTYLAPTLRIRTPQGEVYLDPIARDVLGGVDGRVDLEAWPSWDRVMLLRKGNRWQIKSDAGISLRRTWNRRTFVQLTKELTGGAMNRGAVFQRIEAVQHELESARFGVGHAIEAVSRDPSLLVRHAYPLKLSQLRRCAANLELTYVVRLFAEFEGVLRQFWAAARTGASMRVRAMEAMMNRVAASQHIDAAILRQAHDVRRYRNAIVHDSNLVGRLPFEFCKTRLKRFLGYLPRHW